MPPPIDEKIIIDGNFSAGIHETQKVLAELGKMAMEALLRHARGELPKDQARKIMEAEKATERSLLQMQKAAGVVALVFEQALKSGDEV